MKYRVSAKHSRLAMTLVEVMVCAFLGTMALMVAMQVWLYTSRSFAAMQNYSDLDQHSQMALDTLSHDVRQAGALLGYSTNYLILTNLNGSLLYYVYIPSGGTQSGQLMRFNNGRWKVLLTDCDYLKFNVSQRYPSNDFTFYPDTPTSKAKLIDVAWKCSRKIYGIKAHTESIQSAKVVIRN
jgi:hypothetical protein